MDIYGAIVTRLEADTTLTGLISTRLYPNEIPQGDTLPAVFYMTVSDVKDHFLTGQSSLESPIIQFTVYASTKAGAAAVASAIKTSLRDYQGTLSDSTVDCIRLINELPSRYTSDDGTTKIYTHDLEFEVWHKT